MKACKYCNTPIDPSEVYGNWFYCKPCKKEWTLCKSALHLHSCGDDSVGCVENENTGDLIVYMKKTNFVANFCPFCGYKSKNV